MGGRFLVRAGFTTDVQYTWTSPKNFRPSLDVWCTPNVVPAYLARLYPPCTRIRVVLHRVPYKVFVPTYKYCMYLLAVLHARHDMRTAQQVDLYWRVCKSRVHNYIFNLTTFEAQSQAAISLPPQEKGLWCYSINLTFSSYARTHIIYKSYSGTC